MILRNMAGPESWLRPTLTACLPRDDRTRPRCDLRHLREPPGGQFLERLITRTVLACELDPRRSAQRFDGLRTMETLCRLS